MGGVDRRGSDGLGGSQFHIPAGQRDRELHGLVPGGARVAIGGQGEDGAGFDQFVGRGVVFFSETERGTGQGYSYGIRSTQRSDILIGCFNQVIGGGSAQFRGKRSAAQVVEFVGVDLERETEFFRLLQDLRR